MDHHNVQEIRRRADYEIERHLPKRVIFDFNNVSFMDSAGIGLIIGRYKLANMLGGKVHVTNMSTPIRKIYEMSGMQKIIPEVNVKMDSVPNCVKMDPVHFFAKKTSVDFQEVQYE